MDAHEWISENCRFAGGKKTKGYLVVFEGIDGAGKTTQSDMLVEWLEKHKYSITRTKWNSSDLISDAISLGKDKRELTPMLYSLMHASDLIWRWQNVVEPALKRGHIVVADRWFYTSYVRDALRGIEPSMLDKIYKEVREPDLVFHCVSPVETAFARLMGEKGLTYYGSGMDIEYAKNREESCMKYEAAMDREYKKVLPSARNYFKLDTNRSEKDIFKTVKDEVKQRFDIGDE